MSEMPPPAPTRRVLRLVMPSYYHTLGIPLFSSIEEVKTAFRALAMKHHPDRGGDEAEFKKISAAYAVIGKEDSKALYDARLRGSSAPRPAPSTAYHTVVVVRVYSNPPRFFNKDGIVFF